MRPEDWVTLIGIGITFIVSVVNLIMTQSRNKHSDYLSMVSNYRLKWIDLARMTIADYLLSVDRLCRGNDTSINDDYATFLEKHWYMKSFITNFSPREEEARILLNDFYEKASKLLDSENKDCDAIRQEIHRELPKADTTLRNLMDANWLDVKNELDKGEKKSSGNGDSSLNTKRILWRNKKSNPNMEDC